MYPTTKVSGAVPTPGVQTPTAATRPNPAHVELIRSADVLSRAAESRPGGYVQGAELVDMANNIHGQYPRDIQHAARVFLANSNGVYRAREAIRRRNANPHSACAGGRAYDFQDLQSICDYMQQHQHDQQGQKDQEQRGQHGGYRPFAHGMEAGMAGLAVHGLMAQLVAAIQHVMLEMTNLRRQHMSLERLMHMGHRGNPGAQYLLNQPDMLLDLVNREVSRNMAITFDRLQRMGLDAGMQQNGAGMTNSYPHASFGGAPDFSGFPDISPPASPAPDFDPAADVRKQDTTRQHQLARETQARQDERQRLIRNDAVRNTQLRATHHRADALVQQRRIGDDVAADGRVADDIAARQRQAAEIRADEIKAEQIRADEMRADEIRADQIRADQA